MMLWPLSETLQFISPAVPAALVPPAAWVQLQQGAGRLPDAFTSYYLECRLGANAAQVDFSASVTTRTGGCDILAAQGETAVQAGAPRNALLWPRVWTFLRTWAAPDSVLHQEIPLLWLEFDDAGAPWREAPAPGIVLCLDPEHLKTGGDVNAMSHRNPKCMQPLVATVLACLLDQPLGSPLYQTLGRCFAALPERGKLFYLSVMLSRQPATVKVSGTVPKAQFLSYLRQVGWRGEFAALEMLLTTFARATDVIRFDLCVDALIAPRIGIEFFSGPQSHDQTARQQFLTQLVDTGLCTPEKRAAVEAWEDDLRAIYPQQSWPTRIRRSWYIKVVYQPDQALEAKAYLGFAPGLFSPFVPA